MGDDFIYTIGTPNLKHTHTHTKNPTNKQSNLLYILYHNDIVNRIHF